MSEIDERDGGGLAWPWLVFPLLPLLFGLSALHLINDESFAFAVPGPGVSCLKPAPNGFVAAFVDAAGGEYAFFEGLLVYVSVGFLHTVLCLLAVAYFVAQIRQLTGEAARRAWWLAGLLIVILVVLGILAALDGTALQLTYRNTCELLCKAQVADHIVPRECHGGSTSALLWLASIPTLAGMIAAVSAAAWVSSIADALPKGAEGDWRTVFAGRVQALQRAFYLTSLVLVTSTVAIKLFLELPLALAADKATTAAVGSFAGGMTVFWGTVFTLTLVMIFAPAVFLLSMAAQRYAGASEAPEEVRTWLSQQISASIPRRLGNVATALAPLLVGPVGSLLQKLAEGG